MSAALQYPLFIRTQPVSCKLAGGLRPVSACLKRLFETEVTSLPQLLAFECARVDGIPTPDLTALKAAAILEQPKRIAARQSDLASAATWELERFGCVLLKSNPYFQPQMWGAL